MQPVLPVQRQKGAVLVVAQTLDMESCGSLVDQQRLGFAGLECQRVDLDLPMFRMQGRTPP